MRSAHTPSLLVPRASLVARGALLLASVLLVVGSAHAQPASEAQSLFRRGLEHVDRGELASAATAFERSLELHPRASTAYNLASVLSALGRVEEPRDRGAGEVVAECPAACSRAPGRAAGRRGDPRRGGGDRAAEPTPRRTDGAGHAEPRRHGPGHATSAHTNRARVDGGRFAHRDPHVGVRRRTARRRDSV
jgi:hypothetical protein